MGLERKPDCQRARFGRQRRSACGEKRLLAAVTYAYTATGYLSEVRKTSDNSLLWHANQLTASGQTLSETLGNNLVTTRGFDVLDRLSSIQSGSGTTTVHQQTYVYDLIGNLTQRVDQVQSVTENFAYDSLNRLAMVSGPSLTTRTFSYDAIGNITYKSDVGAYTYPASGAASVRPHAIANVGGYINASYTYDANGNLTTGNGRTLTYASFNLPATVAAPNYSYTYTYSAEHERVRLVTVRPDDTLTTIYLHPNGGGQLLYEKETKQSTGEAEHKFYVSAGSALVGVYVINNTVSEMRYYHRDNLGSVAVITNQSGAVLERLAYEAFGERRNANGTPQDRASPLIGITTDRGFTAHEHLDELNLIHMNGRIYDPALGRFMTADPFLQSPGNMQSYNRYSYVFNNPLGYVDPTGYFSFGKLFAALLAPITDKDVFRTAITIAAAYYFGPVANFGAGNAIINGAIGGFAGGLVGSGGNLEAGLRGGFTGGLFGWAGTVGPAADSFERYAAHALAGCIGGEIGGGGCGRGAVSAVAGKFATNATDGNFIATVVAGGTVSVISGGKFVNGAYTAAFGYLFNECAHNRCWGKDAAYSAPLAPPGVDVDNNIKDAGAASFGLKGSSWFYDEVRNKGPWDYKQLGSQYQDFGNFNYGASGAAFGYSEDTLLRMAGWAQVQAGTSQPGWGVAPNKYQAYLGVGGRAPYGDDPSDQSMIKRGIEYYRALRGN